MRRGGEEVEEGTTASRRQRGQTRSAQFAVIFGATGGFGNSGWTGWVLVALFRERKSFSTDHFFILPRDEPTTVPPNNVLSRSEITSISLSSSKSSHSRRCRSRSAGARTRSRSRSKCCLLSSFYDVSTFVVELVLFVAPDLGSALPRVSRVESR